jgi:predicted CopG family antitoxin
MQNILRQHQQRVKSARKNISLDSKTYEQLKQLGKFGYSYNDIILDLLANNHQKQLTKEIQQTK